MINFCNQQGHIDLNLIDDAEVAKLDEPRKVALQRFIDAVLAKVAAENHYVATRTRVKVAMAAEDECFAAHNAVAPAPTFMQLHAASIAAYQK